MDMPNIKSAIKRVKTTKTKNLENTMVKTEYKTAVKKFLSEVESGDKKNIETSYKIAVKAVEKAANKGVIKANTASRKKSALDKALNSVK